MTTIIILCLIAGLSLAKAQQLSSQYKDARKLINRLERQNRSLRNIIAADNDGIQEADENERW